MLAKNTQNKNEIKKYISLSVSLLITFFIFSMSLLTGTTSGEISSSLSVGVKQILDTTFVDNNISIDTLHTLIRKSAHIFEYFILGISYFFTAKYWRLSILKVLVVGLLTATIDELLQTIPADRYASALDIFVFDFGGFVLGFGLLLLLMNRQNNYTNDQVLQLLQEGKIKPRKAYKQLYSDNYQIKFTNKAHFLKLKIVVPGEKGVNRFLRFLFFFPIPLALAKFILLFVKDEKMNIPFSKDELIKMISSKGIKVDVFTSTNEKIIIKTI